MIERLRNSPLRHINSYCNKYHKVNRDHLIIAHPSFPVGEFPLNKNKKLDTPNDKHLSHDDGTRTPKSIFALKIGKYR